MVNLVFIDRNDSTPSDFSKRLARRIRLASIDSHFECRQASVLSTYSLLYFQSRAPVLYGGSM